MLLREGPIWAVLRVVAFEQRMQHRAIHINAPVDISLSKFVNLTGMSKATISRALAKARDDGRITVTRGGGHGVRSEYALADLLSQPATVSSRRELSQPDATTVSSGVAHKEVIDSG